MGAGELVTVVYSSTAVEAFSEQELEGLLVSSRRNNAREGVTGMLLYREGRFLQVLEGPEGAVRGRMIAITGDSRHRRLRVLLQELISERQFPDWTMAYPSVSAEAQEMTGYRAAFADVTEQDQGQGQDEDPAYAMRALRELIQWFQDRAIPLR